MSRKTIKILSIVLTMAVILMTFAVPVFADGETSYTPDSFKGTTSGVDGLPELAEKGNKVIGTIQVVGMLISVIILMVLGIKYMMGSAEEKASYKKTMIPYLVGAVLLFAASSLANMVYKAVVNM